MERLLMRRCGISWLFTFVVLYSVLYMYLGILLIKVAIESEAPEMIS
jgi:hypothetical protein